MNERTQRFHEVIRGFIEARRDAKLKDGQPDPAQASKYEYEAWVADAAKRVGQIQSVTHVLKATHPDAKGKVTGVAPSANAEDIELKMAGADPEKIARVKAALAAKAKRAEADGTSARTHPF